MVLKCDQRLLPFLDGHIRLLTRCKSCFTLGMFCKLFFSKITEPFLKKSHECALKLTDLWITSLLFDLALARSIYYSNIGAIFAKGFSCHQSMLVV